MLLLIVILGAVSALLTESIRRRRDDQVVSSAAPPMSIARSGNVKLDLRMRTDRFEAGDEIPLDWGLTNDTDEPITVWFGHANYNLVVRDERGEEPRLSAEGRRRRTAFQERRRDLVHADIARHLAPGQASSDSNAAGLSEWYDLAPGRYTVEMAYREASRETRLDVRSRSVAFEVIPTTKPTASGRILLKLRLDPKKPLVVGRPMPLAFEVHNDSSRPVLAWLGHSHHDLLVLDDAGREAPLTEAGRRHRDEFLRGGAVVSQRPLVVKPRKSVSSGWGAGMSTWYELKPGRYTAQLVYREPTSPPPEEIRSSRESFEVVPEGPDAPPLPERPLSGERRADGSTAYRDAASGMTLTVEADGRTIVADDAAGKRLWRRNPFEDAGLKPYRVEHPVVSTFRNAPVAYVEHARNHGMVGPFLLLTFTSSQFGILDLPTGNYLWLGRR